MFHVPQYVYLIFHNFQCFSPHPRSYQLIFSIPELVSFIDIFQVLYCAFLIFHVFHCFLPYSKSYSVSVSHFPRFFHFSRHNPGPTIWVCHFSCWSVLSPYSRSYSVHFSFLPFSVFLAIFQVLQCVCLFFHVFQFSHHPTLGISYFPGFLVVLAIFQVKQCSCTIFDVFQFSRHIPGSTVYNSPFSRFSVFLAIFLVIPCLCLIFHVFVFYRHITGPTVCISHFSCFSLFLPIFQVLLCVSHFPWFSVFLAIFKFLSEDFLNFRVGQVSGHIPRPAGRISHFFTFFTVSRHIPCLTRWFSHFPCWSVFLPYLSSYSVCAFLFFHIFHCF